MLYCLARSILAQLVLCKHTDKVMLYERPSMRMCGAPSLLMSGCVSVKISKFLLLMISDDPSLKMSGRLSVMMSEQLSVRTFRHPLLMIFKQPIMRISGRPSMMMSGRLSVMLSGHLSIRMFGHPSLIISGQPLVRISRRPSVRTSGRPSMTTSRRHSMTTSRRHSMKTHGCPSMKTSGCPSIRMLRCPSVRPSGRPSMKTSSRQSMKTSGHPLIKTSRWPTKKISGHPLIKTSRWPTTKISGLPLMKKSGRPLMRKPGRSSVKMSGCLSMKICAYLSAKMSRHQLLKISGHPSMKMSVKLLMRISGWQSTSMSRHLSMRMFGRPIVGMSGKHNEEFHKEKTNKTEKIEYGTRYKEDIQVAEDNFCDEQNKQDFLIETVNETSPPKRYIGLENQGATCYLNTVLQILFMTEDFRKAAERHHSTISIHLAQLFEQLKSGERNIATTHGITGELKINVHKQEDAAKFLQKILNKVDPEMAKLFQGIKVDTTTCKKTAKHHEPLRQFKTFFTISISLESNVHINLQSCFDSYFAPIKMCGEDQQIFCNDCQMFMDTEMTSSLQKVPLVLVLHLERFELDYDTMCCVKNDSLVQIPARLSVEEKADKTNKYCYDLYAMANHVGSLNGGHYYAVIKSFEDHQWYRFDDSFVEEIKKYDLDNHLSREACILLYKKSIMTTGHSQTVLDNQNIMKNRTNRESANCEKEVSNTENIKENYENSEKNLKNTYSIKDECEDPEKDEMNNYIREECKASEKHEINTDCIKDTCKIPEKDGINSDSIKDECENPEKNKMNTNSIKGQCEFPEKDDMYIDGIKDESDDPEDVEMNTDIHELKNPEKVDMNTDIRDGCKSHDKKDMNTHSIKDECRDHEIDETNCKITIYCVEPQHSFDLEEKSLLEHTDNSETNAITLQIMLNEDSKSVMHKKKCNFKNVHVKIITFTSILFVIFLLFILLFILFKL
ncbi:uncharacterized protein LOC130425369 isoform X2 [Triplophysa dalaica]|uniref:uncharacterized protein LOC130425369 isoform X2 n=1 Tax=Triplophysa dalaica TaxID=1582913 RepID=UPI0024E02806|nr:uncharacterized protein LOC130425369 isoform X2 [Triplophysa dalaica]